MPAQSAGSVIGRHGRTVRKLEEETGARISIDAAGGDCTFSGVTPM
ncbi:KH domain-containing protein [Tessaracoccus lapidicaptus]